MWTVDLKNLILEFFLETGVKFESFNNFPKPHVCHAWKDQECKFIPQMVIYLKQLLNSATAKLNQWLHCRRCILGEKYSNHIALCFMFSQCLFQSECKSALYFQAVMNRPPWVWRDNPQVHTVGGGETSCMSVVYAAGSVETTHSSILLVVERQSTVHTAGGGETIHSPYCWWWRDILHVRCLCCW